ncbi:sigma-54-dependent Fis family transcriptional regulator [Bacillus dakarensis]|uniref:sigma-54-dependent Fis family transcriptional regulator n=1 Tax=Robertmurraya dakarensis TaxID=1926278 RepID=UPI000A003EAA|nr:sigma-54-dependent Fis family transcriptional regulator [Bacillus dakarensis]
MLVKDIMTTNFVCCSKNQTLGDVLPMFTQTHSDMLPVVNEFNHLIGIITKNQIFKILTTKPSFETTIDHYYKPEPVYIRPNDNIDQTRRLLLQKRIGHAPVVDEKMKPIGVISTKQALSSYNLIYSHLESQFELLFNHLNFGLFSINKDFQISASNSLAHRLLNIKHHETDAFKQMKNLSEMKELIEEILMERSNAAKKQLTLNGLSLYVQCYPLIRHDELVGAMVIIEDVTRIERTINELQLTREWEQKLRSVIEFAYDAIILVNKRSKITMVNKGFTDLFGLSSSSILEKSTSELFPELEIDNVIKSGISVQNVPQIINGQQSLISILPIKESGETISAICKITYRGLTHLHEALTKVKKLEKQLSAYQNEINEIKGTKYTLFDIAGESDAIRKVKHEATLASRSMSTVLIIGESGTGKELFAQGIHASSGQKGTFVQVNCAAIPSELLESELFGYADGAFTGAQKGGVKGKFELAQNGTIFLDEIGDMPLPLQTKILRVLQEKEFQPIGSSKTIHLNTKIIAATNRNIEELIKDGKFREDLYYRLNIIRLNIPPLRERMEDLPDIIQEVIKRLNKSGFYIRGVTHSALTKLMKHSWPGNVRELHNVLERAANLKTSDYIDAVDIPAFDRLADYTVFPERTNSTYKDMMQLSEKEMIQSALKEANGNKTKASKLLGISRPWLYSKIKKYNIQ